jgi:hypothetical protein
MEGLYQWIVLLHVIAAFTFALAHGVSGRRGAEATRRARDPARAGAARLATVRDQRHVRLDLRAAHRGRGCCVHRRTRGACINLGRDRPLGADVRRDVRASTWFRDLRRAAGQAYETGKGAQPAQPPDAASLATLTASSRPMEIAAIGYGGLVLILWLMVMKPF